ncbi:MAG: tetratricopeptide repeat protein [Planctomycetes bacterium]|nr:tetratricopeptide repeat protein [Planctomycetota bacterium]
MARIAVVIALVWLASAPVTGAQDDPDLRIGLELYAAGKYEMALGSFRAVIEARPDKPAASVAAGRCLIALGRTAEAIECLVRAASPGEPSAELSSVLGQAYYWSGLQHLADDPSEESRSVAQARLSSAVDSLNRAVAAAPDADEALYFLGRTRLQSGAEGAAAAEKALARAVQLKPDQPSYREQLGEALLWLGRFPEAAAAYRKAAELAGAEFQSFRRQCLVRAGQCHGLGGDAASAEADFRAAFELGPEDTSLFLALWEVYATDADRYDDGIRILEALAVARRDAALPRYYLGFLQKTKGDHPAARRALEACLETAAGKAFPEAWARVAEYLYHDDGNEAEAARYCQRALGLDAQNETAYGLLQGMVSRRYAAGEWVEAESLTRRLLDARPSSGLEWSNLGLFLTNQRRYKEAWWAYEKALQYEPDRPDILYAAGGLLYFYSFPLDRPRDKARELLERALELAPDNLDAMENLGILCLERGELERARELLQTVVEYDPGRGVAMRELNKTLHALRTRAVGPGATVGPGEEPDRK